MPQGVAPVAADRRFDPSAARPWSPDDERDVMTIELMAAHELLQPAVRLLRAGDHHQPRRVTVEPVHDAGPVGISAGDVVLEESVHECPGCMPGCRVNDEPGRLVDDDEIVVLVGDPKIHRLRNELRRPVTLRRVELELLPAHESPALGDRLPIDEHGLCFEQAFGDAPRADLRERREKAV